MLIRFGAAAVFAGAAAYLLLTSAVPPTVTSAFVEKPPLATTGGFGEETCRKCHFDYELNDPRGSLRLEGIPDAYAAGGQYLITVRLAHPDLERGGFELTARFVSGELAGRQAGSFEIVDSRATVSTAPENSVQYAMHTRAGSSPDSKGAIAWSLRWRAPEDGAGGVVFHAAANASNYDDSPLGDFPYSQTANSARAAALKMPLPHAVSAPESLPAAAPRLFSPIRD